MSRLRGLYFNKIPREQENYFDFNPLIAADKRDFVRAAAFKWITFRPAARSSFCTSVLNSFSLSSIFFAAIASRTFRN
jgi:hypothetical protein